MTKKKIEARERKIVVEMKYGVHDKAPGGKKISNLLFMFLTAALVFGITFAQAYGAQSAVNEPEIISTLTPAAGADILADNIFIFLVPLAVALVLYMAFVLHQIKENTSNER